VNPGWLDAILKQSEEQHAQLPKWLGGDGKLEKRITDLEALLKDMANVLERHRISPHDHEDCGDWCESCNILKRYRKLVLNGDELPQSTRASEGRQA
jgi:hypothetical protein